MVCSLTFNIHALCLMHDAAVHVLLQHTAKLLNTRIHVQLTAHWYEDLDPAYLYDEES
jgi:hypothetical protein